MTLGRDRYTQKELKETAQDQMVIIQLVVFALQLAALNLTPTHWTARLRTETACLRTSPWS